MKKLFVFVFTCFFLITKGEVVKMALLQPRIDQGSTPVNAIERNMVRGELRNSFSWQSNFQVLTRAEVDLLVEEHGFQKSGMVADDQRKQIGVMTGAQYICVSTLTKYQTQLYIEAYLINIETGEQTNAASQYINLVNNDFSALPDACNKLAEAMLGEISGVYRKSGGNTGVSSSVNYRTIPQGYVDLGLPSGTLWKNANEGGDYARYTYDEAVSRWGSKLPTVKQLDELIDECTWTWTGSGYKVTGPNGNSITLPAAGYRNCLGDVVCVGTYGSYWSSTPNDSGNAWRLYFNSSEVYMYSLNRCYGQSVRLVQN